MIKKIISLFTSGKMDLETRMLFRAWLASEHDREEKDEALLGLWNSTPSKVTLEDRIRTRKILSSIHLKMGGEAAIMESRHRGRRTGWAYACGAAAILILGIFISTFIPGLGKEAESIVRLVAAENSKGNFTLPDGTQIWLNSSSALTYDDKSFKTSRKVHLSGEAWFDVAKNESSPFVVDMDDFQIKVTGTRFLASGHDGFSRKEVILQEGQVILGGELVGGEPVVMSPGQKFTYDYSSGESSLTQVKAEAYSKWTKDRIVFQNESLGDVLTAMEHRYNVRFHVGGGIDLSQRLSFTLHPEPLDETLHLIEILTGYKSTKEDSKTIFLTTDKN